MMAEYHWRWRRSGTYLRCALPLLAACLAGCHAAAEPTPRTIVRVIGNAAIVEPLVNAYAEQVAELDFEVVRPGATLAEDPLQELRDGMADLALATAASAYFASHDAPDKGNSRLRALSMMPEVAIHLVVRKGSGIHKVADLQDRRIVACSGCTEATAAGPWTAAYVVRQLLESFGLDPHTVRGAPLPLRTIMAKLVDGSYDAVLVPFYYPHPFVTEAIRHGAYILPLEGDPVERLRLKYPFVRVVRIPAGTYPRHPHVIETIGIDNMLVCREDLPERVAYMFTRILVEGQYGPSSALRTAFRHMEMERAATTPIPLHAGAARYFREWELFR